MMNEMMDILVNEQGLSKEEAFPIAAIGSAQYGSVAGMTEALVPTFLARATGIHKASKGAMRRMLSKMVKEANILSKTGKKVTKESLESVGEKSIKEIAKENGNWFSKHIMPYLKGIGMTSFEAVGEMATEALQYAEEKAFKIASMNKNNLMPKDFEKWGIKDEWIKEEDITSIMADPRFFAQLMEDPEFHASAYGGLVGGGVMSTVSDVSRGKMPKDTGRKGKFAAKEVEAFLTGKVKMEVFEFAYGTN